MNNQKKAERACRRFARARKRQNYTTPIQGTEGRMLEVVGDIDLKVASIEPSGPLTEVRVTAVLHDVNITVWSDAPDADTVATKTAELAVERSRDQVVLEDMLDTYVEVMLSDEDATILATYIGHALDLFGDGLAFRVNIGPTEAVIIAPVEHVEDGPDIDQGNVLPLAQAKFEAMVAA
nr:hypothetical protein [Microbacterium barkeri]